MKGLMKANICLWRSPGLSKFYTDEEGKNQEFEFAMS